MQVSRRDFVRYCSISAAALGLSATDVLHLEDALANPNAPSVLWLQGAGCTGCSISLLNRVSTAAPTGAADLLVNSVNLAYHPNLMSLAGESAVQRLLATYNAGGYVLVVEGGVPTAFGGSTCWAWSYQGRDVTFQEAVTQLSSRAAAILCAGTCASWGGMAAASPNPTGVKGVSQVTGRPTINISGCPPHPDWIVWTIAQLLLGRTVARDTYGRPSAIYNRSVHSVCPRREHDEAERYGLDGYCLKELGCRGPETQAPCPTSLWNNGVNWCVGANAPCIGCTQPTFPGDRLSSEGEGGGD